MLDLVLDLVLALALASASESDRALRRDCCEQESGAIAGADAGDDDIAVTGGVESA